MPASVIIDPFLNALGRDAVILTPGLRLARQLTQAWADHVLSVSGAVAPAPAIFPLDAWLEQCWNDAVEGGLLPPTRLLNRVEQRQLWQQVIEQDLSARSDFSLLQPRGAAERALQARTQWLLSGGDTRNRKQRHYLLSDPDCAAFERWLTAFEARLETHGWTTRADIYRSLLSIDPRSLSSATLHKGQLILAFALSMPKLTAQVLEHINGGTLLHLPCDDALHGGDNGAVETGAVGSRLLGRAYPDKRRELSAAAAWAAARYRASAGSTAIVLPDIKADRPELEYHLRREFDCLDTRYDRLPVNFSTGMPLSDTPVFRDALLALSLGEGGGTPKVSRESVLALLRSPYLAGTDAHRADVGDDRQGLRVLRALNEHAAEMLDVADLVHWVSRYAPGSPLALALATLQDYTHRSASRGRRYPSAWITLLKERLFIWGWPARTALDSLEYQQVERLDSSLDELASLDDVAGEVTYGGVLTLWQRVLEDTVFQPKTEDNAIQVLGVMEAVGLSFNALWVCTLQSGVLPESSRLLPLLPGQLQRLLRIPQADPTQLLAQAQSMLRSWQQTHHHIIASCHQYDGGVTVPHSPLLHLDSQIYEPEAQALVSPPPKTNAHWPDAMTCEVLDEGLTPVSGELVAFGGGASVLANQSNCPFRAWVTHHLGPAVIASVSPGLSAAERGSLIHEALFEVWGLLGTANALGQTEATALALLVSSATSKAMERIEARASAHHQSIRKRVGSACLDLERARIEALLLEWLDLETGRTIEFQVVEQEQKHTLSVGPLTLTLRPDRVDQLADGRRLVVDYKTGSVNRSSWLGERPRDPQLPLYALVDNDVTGIAFGRVRQGDSTFVALGESLGLGLRESTIAMQLARLEDYKALTWEALVENWRAILTQLAEDYAAGHASVDPLPQACRYCALDSICRVNESIDTQRGNIEQGGGLSA